MTLAGRNGGLGLEYLSVFGMPLPDYVELAAQIGCDFVSVNFGRTPNPLGSHPSATLRDSAALRTELAAAVLAQGLRIELVEGFAVNAEAAAEDYAADLDAVARLGARSICAVSLEKDIGRTRAQFAVLAEMAAERSLLVTTEVGAGVMRNFNVACDTWREVGHPNFALLIDTMHFFRRGATPEDLDSVPASAIGHVQLCDVPMPAKIESYMEEALFERRCPGVGDLPLDPFLARLAATVPIGLEVPIRSEAEAGIDAETRLRRCVSAARSLIAGTDARPN